MIPESDARRSLDMIEDTTSSMIKAFDRQAGRIILAWGIAYLFGPLCMAVWPTNGVILLELLLVSAIGYTIYETSRKSIVTGKSNSQIGVAWGLLYLFGTIWFMILSPFSIERIEVQFMTYSQQMWSYGVCLAMFAYVLMGLWMGRFYLILGTTITVSVLVGRFVLMNEGFWIWSGLTQGGAMLIGGWLLLSRSRRQA